MGECIEISMLSATTEPIEPMWSFLKRYLKSGGVTESFAVMDNWEYENQTAVGSLAEAMEKGEGKIVSAEAGGENAHIGVFAERTGEGCAVECWINPQTEFSDQAYKVFTDEAVELLRNMKAVIVCAVGREMYVNYSKGIAEAVRGAHGADLWLLPRSVIETCGEKLTAKFIWKDK